VYNFLDLSKKVALVHKQKLVGGPRQQYIPSFCRSPLAVLPLRAP